MNNLYLDDIITKKKIHKDEIAATLGISVDTVTYFQKENIPLSEESIGKLYRRFGKYIFLL